MIGFVVLACSTQLKAVIRVRYHAKVVEKARETRLLVLKVK